MLSQVPIEMKTKEKKIDDTICTKCYCSFGSRHNKTDSYKSRTLLRLLYCLHGFLSIFFYFTCWHSQPFTLQLFLKMHIIWFDLIFRKYFFFVFRVKESVWSLFSFKHYCTQCTVSFGVATNIRGEYIRFFWSGFLVKLNVKSFETM